MICVVDASVAVKWFAEGDWALREDDIEPALELLKTSTRGTLDFYQPPHFLAEVAAVVSRLKPAIGHNNILMIWHSSTSPGQLPQWPTPELLNWPANWINTCSTRFTTQWHCPFRVQCWSQQTVVTLPRPNILAKLPGWPTLVVHSGLQGSK
jgi:hypothetical protein